MSFGYSRYDQPKEPDPRYNYQVLTIWWPEAQKNMYGRDTLAEMGRQGWRIIDVRWTGDKNEQGQERIIYHLEWTPEPKAASYTIKEQR